MTCGVPKIVKKRFSGPAETRPMNKGKAEIVSVGDAMAMRVTFEPGWRWSDRVEPAGPFPVLQ
jgi:hypothetical protein